MPSGGCHCGAIRYTVEGEAEHSALCHCSDCRKSAGAPMVGWALFPADKVRITGDPVRYRSSEHATRSFCGTCGTGLFYTSDAIFQGKIDIQTATLDDPDAYPPTACIQVAEAAHWMEKLPALPRFARFPG
ncbi:GFA family protein [Sphingobium aquiterrae]|uniref:GFA family protein n=1 Tax=Sphingobium aquiterrae TaxID=2038656 RepID=UPI00301AB2BE